MILVLHNVYLSLGVLYALGVNMIIAATISAFLYRFQWLNRNALCMLSLAAWTIPICVEVILQWYQMLPGSHPLRILLMFVAVPGKCQGF
jgi:hypothetical protein